MTSPVEHLETLQQAVAAAHLLVPALVLAAGTAIRAVLTGIATVIAAAKSHSGLSIKIKSGWDSNRSP